MKLIRKFCAVIFCTILTASAFAVDFGGSLDNNTKLSTISFDSWSLLQQDGLTAWLKVPFNNEGSLYFATEGTMLVSYNIPDLSNASAYTFDFLLDLSLFKLAGVFNIGNNVLQLNVGRFYLSDVTGIVLSQTADGLQLGFTSDYFKASVYGGYTGLTNAMFGTMNDDTTTTSFNPDASNIYCFNSPYIVTGATIAAPYLFANQTIGAEFYGMFGSVGPNGGNSGYNRTYITLFMNGPIVKNLFYTLSSTLAFNNGPTNLTMGTLSYYPKFKSSSITLNAIYASGDSGSLKAFSGFTSSAATYAFSAPNYTSLIKVGLRGSLKPLESLYTAVGSDVIFDTGSESGFRGVQWDANLKYQILTDIQVSLIVKQYFDFKNNSDNNTSFTLNASLAF